jgi:FkbM family methyltransferase
MTRPRDPRRLLRGLFGPPDSPVPPAPAPAAEEPVPDWLQRDGDDNANMRRLVSYTLGPADTAIDIGSNHGGLLQEMVRVAPRGRHLAFEPVPELAEELRRRFPAVEVHEAAASNHHGEATFLHARAADGWSGLKFRPLPTGEDADILEIKVKLEPLDDVLDPALAPVLIKIDVEGAEQQVIEGALKTLRTHQPTVIFEHGLGSANAFGTNPEDIFYLLAGEVGLRIFDLDGDGPYSLERFRRSYWNLERVNYVAHR